VELLEGRDLQRSLGGNLHQILLLEVEGKFEGPPVEDHVGVHEEQLEHWGEELEH
jgi:hypothetical protein